MAGKKIDRRLIIVANAAFASQANTKCKEIDPIGDDIFTIGLSPTGALPATHYWCSWKLDADNDTSLRAKLAALVAGNRVRIFNGLINTPSEVLTTLGLQRIRNGGVNG